MSISYSLYWFSDHLIASVDFSANMIHCLNNPIASQYWEICGFGFVMGCLGFLFKANSKLPLSAVDFPVIDAGRRKTQNLQAANTREWKYHSGALQAFHPHDIPPSHFCEMSLCFPSWAAWDLISPLSLPCCAGPVRIRGCNQEITPCKGETSGSWGCLTPQVSLHGLDYNASNQSHLGTSFIPSCQALYLLQVKVSCASYQHQAQLLWAISANKSSQHDVKLSYFSYL